MVISIEDVVYARYRAPDLALMEQFLVDFGLAVSVRTQTALYMRGTGLNHHIHVTEKGEGSGAIGFGLLARSEADLYQLAEETGAEVQDSDEPGGGKRVVLMDPAGLRVDIVFGIKTVEPRIVEGAKPFNTARTRDRKGHTQRFTNGPSHVTRLGHVVVHTPNFAACLDFYQRLFGFKISDSYYAGAPEQMMAAFMHCDLGSTYTDHHTIAIIAGVPEGFEHTAFEVEDFDDLMVGNNHLKEKGYRHSWGVGRHVHGSQIFDYWRDPFGNKIEHWTDGDVVNDTYESSHSQIGLDVLAQWAPPMGTDFIKRELPEAK